MSISFIDKYEVVSTIGRGSMGVVYKAKDPEIGRYVAVKTLKSVFLADASIGNEALQRFRQESRSAGRLNHPNIVTVYGAGRTQEGSPYIVMEYIEGRSFETMIAEQGAIDPLAVLHYLSQIASAIDYAHDHDVIHRDIKPSNILIDAGHHPFLLDFGVAKLSDTSLTPAGTVVGTPSYMSPEQIRGLALDGRTDLFSLGVVAYEALTGTRPFPGSDFTTVVSNIIHKDPLPFSQIVCALPSQLEGVLCRAMARERAERHASALEFLDAAADCLGVIVDGSGLVGGYQPGMSLEAVSIRQGRKVEVAATAQHPVYDAGPSSGDKNSGLAWEDLVESDMPEDEVDNAMPVREQQNPPLSDGRKGSVSGRGAERSVEAVMQGRNTSMHSRWSRETLFLVVLSIVALVLVAALTFDRRSLFSDSADSAGDEVTALGLGSSVEPAKGSAKEADTSDIAQTSAESLPSSPASMVQEAGRSAQQAEVQPPESGVITPPLQEVPAGPLTVEQLRPLNDAQLLSVLSRGNDEQTLRLAIAQTGERRSDIFANVLAALAGHPSYLVRVDVIKALSSPPNLTSGAAFDAVVRLLSDSEYLVRGHAAKALGQFPRREIGDLLQQRIAAEKNEVVLKVLKATLDKVNSGVTPGGR